ncbi:hypothetical protein L1987_68934 [Smallanthus sonchifolius]|uniref:Uncharacterized protein n=1 Tax=Smallanthus sonchifolius TaxID=185202 RepID=A0ACB9B6B4_9ASTR|nr:hypothetical protein L1987_68934 [Smallanthus sonchifolius]
MSTSQVLCAKRARNGSEAVEHEAQGSISQKVKVTEISGLRVTRRPGDELSRCMHHTRYSNKSSLLLFDPEIEKTARKNRVFHKTNKVVSSPTNMENKPDHGKQSNLPHACQLPPEQQPSSGVFSSSVPPPKPDENLNQTTNPIPPLPNFGHSLPQDSDRSLPPPKSQPLTTKPSIFHSTPPPGFHPYTSGQNYGDEADGFEDEFDDYEDDDVDRREAERVRPRLPVYRRHDTGVRFERSNEHQFDQRLPQQPP